MYDDVIKRIITEMFEKVDDMSDIEMFYIYMIQNTPLFTKIYRELMTEELIKRGTCPNCHRDLDNGYCKKCNILYEGDSL